MDPSADRQTDIDATEHIEDPLLKRFYRCLGLAPYSIYSLFFAEARINEWKDQIAILQGMKSIIYRVLKKFEIDPLIEPDQVGYRDRKLSLNLTIFVFIILV
ncbi:MAG: hypothetical protein SGJ18_08550 [Pseudomonadota bacterium]|nr:hypothetical protein [Pseudomonadota bacterium]